MPVSTELTTLLWSLQIQYTPYSRISWTGQGWSRSRSRIVWSVWRTNSSRRTWRQFTISPDSSSTHRLVRWPYEVAQKSDVVDYYCKKMPEFRRLMQHRQIKRLRGVLFTTLLQIYCWVWLRVEESWKSSVIPSSHESPAVGLRISRLSGSVELTLRYTTRDSCITYISLLGQGRAEIIAARFYDRQYTTAWFSVLWTLCREIKRICNIEQLESDTSCVWVPKHFPYKLRHLLARAETYIGGQRGPSPNFNLLPPTIPEVSGDVVVTVG